MARTSWADRQRLNLHADRAAARDLTLPPALMALVSELARARAQRQGVLTTEETERAVDALKGFEPRMDLPGGVRARMQRIAEIEAAIRTLTSELGPAKEAAANYAVTVLTEARKD